MHMHGLFLALFLHLITHLLMKLITMVVKKSAEIVLFLMDLEDGKTAFQCLLMIINALQLTQGLAASLLILSSFDI